MDKTQEKKFEMGDLKYAPKEVAKHLPKSNLITVHWRWWWFKQIKDYGFFRSMRIANAMLIWIGPLDITIRCRYLMGPARQLHPDAFVRAGMEDLLKPQSQPVHVNINRR